MSRILSNVRGGEQGLEIRGLTVKIFRTGGGMAEDVKSNAIVKTLVGRQMS